MVSDAVPTALRHCKDDVEAFQRINRADDNGNHDKWQDHRKRDVTEFLPAIGAINFRAFKRIARHGCKATQHDQHDQRRPLPVSTATSDGITVL